MCTHIATESFSAYHIIKVLTAAVPFVPVLKPGTDGFLKMRAESPSSVFPCNGNISIIMHSIEQNQDGSRGSVLELQYRSVTRFIGILNWSRKGNGKNYRPFFPCKVGFFSPQKQAFSSQIHDFLSQTHAFSPQKSGFFLPNPGFFSPNTGSSSQIRYRIFLPKPRFFSPKI